MALEGFDLRSFAQALSVPTEEALGALAQLQRQPEAWQLAFDLLAANDANCRFYGAHTLQAKIAHDWDSLDDDRQHALRGELVRLVVESCDGPQNVLRKTNQALATYALMTVPGQWEGFLPSAVEAIQARARETGKADVAAGVAVLDLLEQFPEELGRTAIASSRRAGLVQDVKSALPLVLRILTAVVCEPLAMADGGDVPAFARALAQRAEWRARGWRAVLQWLQFGISDGELFVGLLDVCLQQLRALAVRRLSSGGGGGGGGGGDVDDGEVEAAAAVADDMLGNMTMASKYGRSIGTLGLRRLSEPWLAEILGRCAEDSGGNGGRGAMVWGAMAVSFGETYAEFVLGRMADPELREHTGAFLQIMLALTRFPGTHGLDEEISDQPLDFWYQLQEALADWDQEHVAGADGDGDGDAGEDAGASADVAATQAAARHVFGEVAKALVAKSTFPAAAAWAAADKDERAQFMSYRREAGDALVTAYHVLREDMLRLLVGEVLGSMDAFSLAHWQHVEALLFALRRIGEAVPEGEAAWLPRLFSAEMLAGRLVPLVAQDGSSAGGDAGAQWGLAAIKAAVIGLIGAYGEWWRGQPALLALAVPAVTAGLAQPALVQAAVTAFRRICESCREQLAGAAGAMVRLACDVLGAGAVPPREQQRIVEAVAEVAMALPPPEQAAALAPLAAALAAAVHGAVAALEAAGPEPPEPPEPCVAALADRLRLVDALARGLQFPDEAERRALAGDGAAARALAAAAQCYERAPALAEVRAALLDALGRAVALPAWPRDARSGMARLDDAVLEAALALVNSSARRGPHALALPFGGVVALVGRAWDAAVARPGGAFGPRWADQCPPLLRCLEQLVAVAPAAAGAGAAWHPAWPPAPDVDRALGAAVGRAAADACAGLAREAASLPAAVEQQPVLSERLFALAARALAARPGLLLHADRAALAGLCALSVHALAVPSRLALGPAAHFVAALARAADPAAPQPQPQPLLALLWAEFGPAWLRAALAAVGGSHPRSLLPTVGELLSAMVCHHLAAVRQWTAQLMAQPGFPSPHADAAAKRAFVRQLLATRSLVRTNAIIAEFSIVCRNLQGAAHIAY
ncbi:hypothetical protein H4R18_002275 [Coemansia javaensis]|uniref:Importin N-terminal domain-containing protein n=1 Tax=Coemansia javaensis TaxID=2761396 RepID=A0A9W8LJF3_9FUNG|nr:hypothetical protein H4R18_002275 [Coemansia javaensis]